MGFNLRWGLSATKEIKQDDVMKSASKWGRLLRGVTAEKGPCTQLRGVDTKEECSKKREHQVKGPTGMSLPCLDIMQSAMEEAISKATETIGWY